MNANTSQKQDDPIQVPGFSVEIPMVPTTMTISTDGYFGMREWQQRCFATLENSHHWIVNAPMASGKTFEICAMAANWLTRDPNLKVVIAVPQRIIAEGFRKNKIELPSGDRFDWAVEDHNDLCKESPKSSTAHLLQFLGGTFPNGIMGRVLLCTHATLVRIPPSAFKNVLIVIDEAHHIRHEGADVGNKLGALVKHTLTSPDGIRLGLTTATWMRGDKVSIIPDLSQFTRFDLPYDEFLSTCQHLRSFSYDFLISPKYSTGLTQLFDERIGKTLVYIPYVNSRYSLGSKEADVAAVLKAIAGCDNPLIENETLPVMRVRRGDQWIRVVNLVDERLREEKQDAIWEAHMNMDDASALDVIIALRMFQEGANWCHADREIIIGQRNSLTEVIQTEGRLFRDVKGKSHVETYHLLPFAFDQTDKSAVREDLNDYMKAILLSMILQDVYSPVSPPDVEPVDGKGGWSKTNYLSEAIPDGTVRAAVIGEIQEYVADAMAYNDSYKDFENFREHYNEIVSTILSGHGVQEYHDEISAQVLHMHARKTIQLTGLNVGHVAIDIIRENNPFGCLLQWGSALLGTVTFQELRAAANAYGLFLPFDEAVVLVQRQGFANTQEWLNWSDRPANIPSGPDRVYMNRGWVNWGHWLGTGRAMRQMLPFDEAHEVVLSQRFTKTKQYREWKDRPVNVPTSPQRVYKGEGWMNWGHWLGTGRAMRQMLPFDEALQLARKSGIKSAKAWEEWTERPFNIPSHPWRAYKGKGWVNWGHWLGLDNYRDGLFLSFDDALLIARASGFKNANEWITWKGRPANLPADPSATYKGKGWMNWGHWLGTGRAMRQMLPFDEALPLARKSGIKSAKAWGEWLNRPLNIPIQPGRVYKGKGWISWGHWLGTGRRSPGRVLPFDEALILALKSGVKNGKEWREWTDRPANLPANPSTTYRGKGWISWGHWLGTENHGRTKTA